MMEMENFTSQLRQDAKKVEANLSRWLTKEVGEGEIYRPQKLIDAMSHGTLNGGKRLRPFLVMQTGAMLGAESENLLQVATALECIHCYSLIHDDLPSMDDDDLRRGKPTVHKAYDEATAILAGDGLLTLAFEILAHKNTHVDPATRLKLVSLLAKASGIAGMVGGQVLDLLPENPNPSLEQIATMQAMKTGALIKFACHAGGVCANATPREENALEQYGRLIGQAFQLADDILDVTASAEQIGKNTDKDGASGKQTQVSIHGVDLARNLARQLVDEACEALAIFGPKAELLISAAKFTINRKS